MRKGMYGSCGINFTYVIEDKQLKYRLLQETGFPVIKDIEQFVNKCVLKILNIDGKNTISNMMFKNTKEDNKKEDKTQTKFYIFFKEIIETYIINEKVVNENKTIFDAIPMGIYLKDNLEKRTIKYKIPNHPINLREKILKVVDSNGEEVVTNNVEIFVDGYIIDETDILDSQLKTSLKTI